ncbi:MAG: hypothetical protein ACREDZ_13250 [Kiloniellales bacterium]
MFLVFYRWGWRAGETVSAATFPAWTAYIERLIQRPAVARAIAGEGTTLFPR